MRKKRRTVAELLCEFQDAEWPRNGTHAVPQVSASGKRARIVDCQHCLIAAGQSCWDCGRKEGCDDGWRGDVPMGAVCKAGCGCWLCPVCDNELHDCDTGLFA